MNDSQRKLVLGMGYVLAVVFFVVGACLRYKRLFRLSTVCR